MLPIWRSCAIEQYGVLVAATSSNWNDEQPVSERVIAKVAGRISDCILLPLNQFQVDQLIFVS